MVLGTSGAAGRIPAGLLRPASPVLRTASQLICAFGGKSRERDGIRYLVDVLFCMGIWFLFL